MNDLELKVIVKDGLVPIYQDQEERRVVNARELHAFLGVGKHFGSWIIDKINKYKFEEDVDFTRFPNFGKSVSTKGGDRKTLEYLLTIDTAKEIAMVENNEKGRQVRQYFIECEKQLNNIVYRGPQPGDIIDGKKIPENYLEAMTMLVDSLHTIQALEADNARMKPKEEMYETFMSSNTGFDIEQTAKLLDFDHVGRNTLYAKLRELNVFTSKNIPTAYYVNMGWFRIITCLTRTNQTYLKPLTLPKGLLGLEKLLLENGVRISKSKLKDMMPEPVEN